MEDFVLNVRHQLDEHFVSLGLVLDERIFLGVTAQINAFAQRVHRVEMLLPEAVDRVQDNVALEALHRGRFFMARLAFVRFFDLPDQELRVLLDGPRFELRFLSRQTKRESDVHPVQQAGVIRLVAGRARAKKFLDLRGHGFIDYLEDELARFVGIDRVVAISVNHLALIVHHVVEIERAFPGEIIPLLDAFLRRFHRPV